MRPDITPRQAQVCDLVLGHAVSCDDAARRLGIGRQGVYSLLARAYRGLGVTNRRDAHYAWRDCWQNFTTLP